MKQWQLELQYRWRVVCATCTLTVRMYPVCGTCDSVKCIVHMCIITPTPSSVCSDRVSSDSVFPLLSSPGWGPGRRCEGGTAFGCDSTLSWNRDPRRGIHTPHQPQHHYSYQEGPGTVCVCVCVCVPYYLPTYYLTGFLNSCWWTDLCGDCCLSRGEGDGSRQQGSWTLPTGRWMEQAPCWMPSFIMVVFIPLQPPSSSPSLVLSPTLRLVSLLLREEFHRSRSLLTLMPMVLSMCLPRTREPGRNSRVRLPTLPYHWSPLT